MVKVKRKVSKAEEGLREMLQGNIEGFLAIPAGAKLRLLHWAGTVNLHGDEKEEDDPSEEEEMRRLCFVVNLFISAEANRGKFYPVMKGLRRAIRKELDRFQKKK